MMGERVVTISQHGEGKRKKRKGRKPEKQPHCEGRKEDRTLGRIRVLYDDVGSGEGGGGAAGRRYSGGRGERKKGIEREEGMVVDGGRRVGERRCRLLAREPSSSTLDVCDKGEQGRISIAT